MNGFQGTRMGQMWGGGMPSAWPAFRGQAGLMDAELWAQWFRASGGRPISVRLARTSFLGQQERPAPERPKGLIGKFDAAEVAKQFDQVIAKAPECFEGEDLTAAQSLVGRLKEFAGSPQSLLRLSDEDEEILKAGTDCFSALARSGPRPAPVASGFPVVPVAIGAGVGAAILALVLALG